MFLVIHSLLGLLIGMHFNSPILIIAFSLFFHFILDIIPHWDGFFDKEYFQHSGRAEIKRVQTFITLADCIITAIIIISVDAYFNQSGVLLGALVSVFPDVIGLGYFTKLKKKKNYIGYLKFHSRIQNDLNWKAGIIIQIILGAIILKILL